MPPQLKGRPFTRAQAEALGLSRRSLQGRRFTRILHDVYAESEASVDPLVRAQALLLIDDVAVLSHFSAARVMGLPVPTHRLGHVSVPRGSLRRVVPTVRVHEWRQSMSPVVFGERRTDPVHTFCDLARWLDLIELVALGDGVVRADPDRLEALRTTVATLPPIAGTSRAREAAALVRVGVDSVPETETRLLFTLAGLPEPLANRTIVGAEGRYVARPDLCWVCSKTAVEYDGLHHPTMSGSGDTIYNAARTTTTRDGASSWRMRTTGGIPVGC